jgi:endonuclease/exonuclease/phosphatase family metal-dependent hydrolase
VHIDRLLKRKAPFFESLDAVRIDVPPEPIELFCAHIPNGSGNGWLKIDTFRGLADALQVPTTAPRVLVGDFNEPRRIDGDGRIVTFGQRKRSDGSVRFLGRMRRKGRDGTGRAWDHAVRSVIAGESSHGLRNAWIAKHGAADYPVTHVLAQGLGRSFDHVFVSRRLRVVRCDVHHAWREEGLSDHAPVSVRVELV